MNDKMKLMSIILILFACFEVAWADALGRLFTEPLDRLRLDNIRSEKIQPDPVVLEEDISADVQHDLIVLKGIVYRSDGKNTAWINNGNTYEDNLNMQHIRVSNDNINRDNVTIFIPKSNTSVRLKVGESFDPWSDSN